MASAVFFLRCQLGFLNRSQTADLSVDFQQLASQRLKPPELSDFRFRLADGCLRREILGHRLSGNFLRELEMRAMPRILGLGAVATRFSAATNGTGDGSWLEITELGDLPEQSESFFDQSGKRVRHGPPCLTVLYALRLRPQKKRNLLT